MTTNHNKLTLRRQSIRTLTADELRSAHGGFVSLTGGTPTISSYCQPPPPPPTVNPTAASPHLPKRTQSGA